MLSLALKNKMNTLHEFSAYCYNKVNFRVVCSFFFFNLSTRYNCCTIIIGPLAFFRKYVKVFKTSMTLNLHDNMITFS